MNDQRCKKYCDGPQWALKFIEFYLGLLVHAKRCVQLDKALRPNGERQRCGVPYCSYMKKVIKHIRACKNSKEGKVCKVPHCMVARLYLSHWKHCSNVNCRFCLPIRQEELRRRAARQAQDIARPRCASG